MIGKKDTMAIFESYQTYLKEQDDNLKDLNTIANALDWCLSKMPRTEIEDIISHDDQIKLSNFLRKPEIVKAYAAFKLPSGLGGFKAAEGDASAANMGEGGVLEVQPDGQYPQ